MHATAPRLAERLLTACIRDEDWRDAVIGDLREESSRVAERRGTAAARRWHVRQALVLSLTFLLRRVPRRPRGSRMAMLEATRTLASGGSSWRGLLRELPHAWRVVRHRPALSAAIVLALGLGLAANAVIFALGDAIVLRPFRFPDVDRLAVITSEPPEVLLDRESVAPGDFIDWRNEATAFSDLAAIEWWEANLTGSGTPEEVAGFKVSAAFFTALGVRPHLGRLFQPSEETPGSHRRVVLSYDLWRSRFAGDPAIVGRAVRLGGEPYDVVGVAPKGFNLPLGAQAWAPLAFDHASAAERSRGYLMVIGRLRDGVTLDEAGARMEALVAEQRRRHPDTNANRQVALYSFTRGMGDPGAASFVAIWQAAALLLLLIACANVANLLLAHGAERQLELAMRLALGASRLRLTGQLLVEGALLSALGILVALPLAWVGLAATRAAFPPSIQRFVPGWQYLGLQPSIFAVMSALAAGATLIFALAPALQAARSAAAESLNRCGRAQTAGGRRVWLRSALATAQIALAIALVTGAGLTIASARRAVGGPIGFEPDGVVTARLTLPETLYADEGKRRRFAERVLDTLGETPAVLAAGITNSLPYAGSNASRNFWKEGTPPTPAEAQNVNYRRVTPGFCRALRIPLLAGRWLDDGDREGSRPVAVVSRSLAARVWPGHDPIGRRFATTTDGDLVTVVGVAGDVMHDWFMQQHQPTVYRPLAQEPPYSMAIAVRTAADPLSLAGALQRAVIAADPDQPVKELRTMQTVIHDKAAGIRYAANALSAMGAVALFLAVMGIYSLISYITSRRQQEMGLRTALGATPWDVIRLTVGQAARIAGAGVAVGAILAFALGRAMEGVLFGTVAASIPLTIAVCVGLGAVTLLASWIPARRAASVDPTIALRAE